MSVAFVQDIECHPDSMRRTQVVNTLEEPFRWIAYLEIYRKNERRKPSNSTGFLIAPNAIASAGHSLRSYPWRRIVRIRPIS